MLHHHGFITTVAFYYPFSIVKHFEFRFMHERRCIINGINITYHCYHCTKKYHSLSKDQQKADILIVYCVSSSYHPPLIHSVVIRVFTEGMLL